MPDKFNSTESKINFQRAKPVRLFEQAVEQIKSLILSGHLKPGDKLPSESELSQMLEVSRSSVREALRSLESHGIIQVRSGAGAFVAEDALVFSSVNDAIGRLLQRRNLVLQLLQVRGAMERLAASQAALLIDEEGLVQLDNILSQQEILTKDGISQNIGELARLDGEFHVAISKACGNEIVFEILNSLVPSFYHDNQAIFMLEKGLKLVQEHRQVYLALKNHDPESAEREMHHHIQRVIDEVSELRKNGLNTTISEERRYKGRKESVNELRPEENA
jgi:GntR family transcriptional repressor for pyruvate dehydrogenase complex